MKFGLGRLFVFTKSAGGWSFRLLGGLFRVIRSDKAGGTSIATPKRMLRTWWDK